VTERKYSVASIGIKIDGFLQSTLDNGGFKVSYEIQDQQSSGDEFETPDVVVKFSGPDVDLLLTNRAELLLALEHLTMEHLRMPSEDHSKVSFDANDYRLLRIEELRLSALTVAENVKRTGTPFRFNPMNSRERRVIHLALRTETTLRSESSGSGPGRHVVVYPAGMPSLPEVPYIPPPRSP
jgi:spoIIIJ-associated protein